MIQHLVRIDAIHLPNLCYINNSYKETIKRQNTQFLNEQKTEMSMSKNIFIKTQHTGNYRCTQQLMKRRIQPYNGYLGPIF